MLYSLLGSGYANQVSRRLQPIHWIGSDFGKTGKTKQLGKPEIYIGTSALKTYRPEKYNDFNGIAVCRGGSNGQSVQRDFPLRQTFESLQGITPKWFSQ